MNNREAAHEPGQLVAERASVVFEGLIGYAILLTSILSLALVAVGVPLAVAVKISAYLWFIVMPLGTLVISRLLPAADNPVASVGMAAALGVVMLPLTVAPFHLMGVIEAHMWVVCTAAVVFWIYELRNSRRFSGASAADVRTFWVIALVATLISIICFLAVSNAPGVLGHFQVQAIGVKAIEWGIPHESPYVAGLPYRDNFGVHLSLLAIAKGASIAIAELGGYAAQMTYLWLAVFTLGVVGRAWLGLSAFACVAAMTSSYFILGYSPINTFIFGSAQSASAMATLSPLLGHISFLLSMLFFASLVSDTKTKLSKMNAFALVLFGAATMLSRANAGALLGLSVLAYWLFRMVVTRTFQFHIGVYVFAIGVGCVSAMLISLGSPIGSDFSGTGFLSFGSTTTLEYLSTYPVSRLGQSVGLPVVAAGAFCYLVFLLFNASFLAPSFWARTGSILFGRGSADETLILLSVAIGILTTLFTFAGGGSNFVFLQLAKLGMCLIGALGLDAAVKSWRRGDRNIFLKALWAMSLCLGAIHVYDIEEQGRKLKPLSRMFAPAAVETLLAKPFDIAPIFEHINPTRATRFIVVHGDDNVWGLMGRVSTTMSHYDLRLIGGDKIINYVNFKPNRSTASLTRLMDIFNKLNASAKNGVLDLPCVVEMANSSLGHDWDIWLLSGKDLRVINHPSVTRRAESRDLIAWHVAQSQKGDSANVCQ
ncbi:MAG: hypothetical protein M0P95_04205 [Sulfuritalea sp.]|nr:hypothetical protein [Sulfuritalea sp.]